MKLKPAVIAAIQEWIKGAESAPPAHAPEPIREPPPAAPQQRKLAEILASGDQAVIAAVTQNIDVFYDRLRPVVPSKTGSHRKAG